MSASVTHHLLPGHNPLGLLQALGAAGKRYNIIGLHSYAYEVNEAVATSALYWNACLWLNQLFAARDSLKGFRFTEQRTSAKTDLQVKAYTLKGLEWRRTCIPSAAHRHFLASLLASIKVVQPTAWQHTI